jgi:hypothetical protein
MVIALAAGVLGAVTFASPVQAAAGGSLQPMGGPPGTQVVASGAGWTANSIVQIWFDQDKQKDIIADGQGAFTAKFNVPQKPAGLYPVYFTAQTERYSVVFTIGAGTIPGPTSPPQPPTQASCSSPPANPFPELTNLSLVDRKGFWKAMCNAIPPGTMDPQSFGRIVIEIWKLLPKAYGIPVGDITKPNVMDSVCAWFKISLGCKAVENVLLQSVSWLHAHFPDSSTRSATVSAAGRWANTGITVSTSRALVIAAKGTWTDGSSTSGPDGAAKLWPDNYFNLKDLGVCKYCARTMTAHWDALVGYIGSNPPAVGSYTSKSVLLEAKKIFLVGGRYGVKGAPRDGTLWLNINADSYSAYTIDNSGSVNVYIHLG